MTGAVTTNRFDWQAGVDRLPPPTPLFRYSAPPSSAPASAMRDLPSPSAERLEALERDAYAKGYEAGEREGKAAAAARVDAMLRQMNSTINEIGALRGGLMRRAERELVRLALAMAERVVRREIDVDRELLAVMARVAIDRLGENAVATIHLNPVDHLVITGGREPDPGHAVELVSDPAIVRGGCMVKSSFGTIDAGIESQIRELSRALLGEDSEEEEAARGVASGV